MLLQVVHETRYTYAPPVRTAQHMAHLKPAHNARQQLLAHELAIDPLPVHRSEDVDAWGNTRTFFSLQAQHEELQVVARSLVSTSPAPAVLGPMEWEEARERLRYHRAAAYDAAAEFAFASPYVPRHAEFVDYALPSFAAGRPLIEATRELMARLHEGFEYE